MRIAFCRGVHTGILIIIIFFIENHNWQCTFINRFGSNFSVVFFYVALLQKLGISKRNPADHFWMYQFSEFFFYPFGGRGLGTENFEVLACYGGGGEGH